MVRSLAAAIATYGLLGDSLMLPIMGVAFSISLGNRSGIIKTLLVSLAAMAMAVAVGFLLTRPIAGLKHPQAIQQVMVRTAPHLLDLMAALATGVAGAFALSRRDVSDTLPGVAILLTGSLVFALMGFRQVALSPFDP